MHNLLEDSQLFLLLKKAGIAIIITQEDGKIIFWNQGAKDLFGYEEEEILEKEITSLFSYKAFIDPFFLLKMDPGARVMTTQIYGRDEEIEGIRKNFTEFPC